MMIGVFVLFATFFSIVEVAITHANRIRIRNRDEKGKPNERANWIMEHQDVTNMAIVMLKTICNTIATTLFVFFMLQLFFHTEAFIFSLIFAVFMVLVFTEFIPKMMVKNHAETIVLKTGTLIYWMTQFMRPMLLPFIRINERMRAQKDPIPSVTEEELKEMIDMSEEEGIINEQEKELVQSALEFNDIIVQEIIKPRIDVVAIDANQSVEEIKEVFLKERFSRLPVYEGDIDHIVGVLSERDFFSAIIQQKVVDIRSLLMEPLFVVGSQKISVLLPELQRRKTHMAIVIDEFGGTEGIVTMEDILEQLVGDIWDEHDETIKVMTQLNENHYLFFADFPIDDFKQVLQVEIPEGNYHTLGGFIVEMLEHIPLQGEQLHFGPLFITVTEVEKRRIRKVRVEVQKEQVSNEQVIGNPSLISEPANG